MLNIVCGLIQRNNPPSIISVINTVSFDKIALLAQNWRSHNGNEAVFRAGVDGQCVSRALIWAQSQLVFTSRDCAQINAQPGQSLWACQPLPST